MNFTAYATDAGQRLVARLDFRTVDNLAEYGTDECYGRRLGFGGHPALWDVTDPAAVAWLSDLFFELPPDTTTSSGDPAYSADYVRAWLDAIDTTAQLVSPSRAADRPWWEARRAQTL